MSFLIVLQYSSMKRLVPLIVMMKRILFLACWTGLSFYCLASLVAGPSGLLVTMETQAASAIMKKNLIGLETLNTRYAQEWDLLRINPETTALEARSLGYLAENEVAIRLSLGNGPISPASAGFRVNFEPESLLSEKTIKYMAGFLTLIVAILGTAVRWKLLTIKGTRQREIRLHAASR